jgi:hypothetical protein
VFASLLWGCDPAKTRGQDATIKSALALAEAQREREALTKARQENPCLDDKVKSVELAKKTGRMLVWWVGMDCCELPALRVGLQDAIHCHCDDVKGDKTPRVIVFDPTDFSIAKRWTKPAIKGKETADEMKQWWGDKKKVGAAEMEKVSRRVAPSSPYRGPARDDLDREPSGPAMIPFRGTGEPIPGFPFEDRSSIPRQFIPQQTYRPVVIPSFGGPDCPT